MTFGDRTEQIFNYRVERDGEGENGVRGGEREGGGGATEREGDREKKRLID